MSERPLVAESGHSDCLNYPELNDRYGEKRSFAYQCASYIKNP